MGLRARHPRCANFAQDQISDVQDTEDKNVSSIYEETT